MRFLHFSDVHVNVPLASIPLGVLPNKRHLGAANLLLRRGRRFAAATDKLKTLASFASSEAVEALLCTGDYTVLGTEPEFAAAIEALQPLLQLGLPLATVPGNHDVYMPDSAIAQRMQKHFGAWMTSDMPELAIDQGWPWVRLFGDHVAAVGIDSTRPNPQLWRSSGRIPDVQLQQLANVLRDPRLRGRFVFVLTHYAPRRPDGTPDRWTHGLENADDLLTVCESMERGVLLHGHIHHRLHVHVGGVHVFGAGSTTDAGREGLWCFDVEAQAVTATPGAFKAGEYVLLPDQAISL